MKELIPSIIKFRKTKINSYRQQFSKLAKRQTPHTFLLTCCDSRIVPTIFTSSQPGELFIMRNIGNIVPPHKNEPLDNSSFSAALEFSIKTLKVSNIIVCGHSECGAMEAMFKNKANVDKMVEVSNWINLADKAIKNLQLKAPWVLQPANSPNQLSKINVIAQLENLITYPLVVEKIQQQQLAIYGWWFELDTANLYYYDSKYQCFKLFDETSFLGESK